MTVFRSSGAVWASGFVISAYRASDRVTESFCGLNARLPAKVRRCFRAWSRRLANLSLELAPAVDLPKVRLLFLPFQGVVGQAVQLVSGSIRASTLEPAGSIHASLTLRFIADAKFDNFRNIVDSGILYVYA